MSESKNQQLYSFLCNHSDIKRIILSFYFNSKNEKELIFNQLYSTLEIIKIAKYFRYFYKTQWLCDTIVEKYSYRFKEVPDEMKTYTMCFNVALINPSMMKYIPYRSFELFKDLLSYNPNLVLSPSFPNSMVELYQIAVTMDPTLESYLCHMDTVNMQTMNHFYLLKNLTHDICKYAIKIYPYNLLKVPDKFLTYELCEYAVSLNPHVIYDVVPRFRTIPLYTLALMLKN